MRTTQILDALMPQIRQKILAAVLRSPETRWYQSDMAKKLGVTPSSLQRELAGLTNVGILLRDLDGNRVYYQANANSPVLPELRGLFAKTSNLADQVSQLLDPFGNRIHVAFIFGSIARGEQTTHSDVDLLIIGDLGLMEIVASLNELEQKLNIAISVTLLGQKEFRSKLKTKNHFVHTIMDGKKIFVKGTSDELAAITDEQ